jgi:hypothetical protein
MEMNPHRSSILLVNKQICVYFHYENYYIRFYYSHDSPYVMINEYNVSVRHI